MLEDTVKFNGIEVIESVEDGDLRTGRNVFESVIEPTAAQLIPPLVPRFHPVEGRSELFEVLADIQSRAENQNTYPLLQLDAHGSARGLKLRNGDRVEWGHLFDLFTAINVATRLNLVVVMSSCFGAHVAGLVHPPKRAPFWGAIGPRAEIRSDALESALRAYYEVFLRDFDGMAAFHAMRAASPPGSEAFGLYPAELLFRMRFHEHVRDNSEGGVLQRRMDRLWEIALSKDPAAADDEEGRREWIKKWILNHPYHFERIKAEFFMHDLFPENVTRFDPQYEDGPPLPLD